MPITFPADIYEKLGIHSQVKFTSESIKQIFGEYAAEDEASERLKECF